MILRRAFETGRSVIVAVLVLTVTAAPALAQNNQQAAQLAVRIQQLEEQIRLLTGQVEGLQFQLTQMQTLIERMSQDNEYRFQQLEGGGATQPMRSGEAPAAPTLPAGETPRLMPSDPMETAAIPTLGPQDQPMHPLPGDAVGESADPLVGTGVAGGGQLVAPAGEGDLANLGGGRPLDLTFGGGGTPVNGDAAAQYAAGYDAIVRGDYGFAEDQFRQFVALYPDDPQTADAFNWLGEALLQRGAYDEAAEVLLEGWQNYPQAPRSPDILLKLGVALAGAGEVDTACRTFDEVTRRYGAQGEQFEQRLASERGRAQCAAG